MYTKEFVIDAEEHVRVEVKPDGDGIVVARTGWEEGRYSRNQVDEKDRLQGKSFQIRLVIFEIE